MQGHNGSYTTTVHFVYIRWTSTTCQVLLLATGLLRSHHPGNWKVGKATLHGSDLWCFINFVSTSKSETVDSFEKHVSTMSKLLNSTKYTTSNLPHHNINNSCWFWNHIGIWLGINSLQWFYVSTFGGKSQCWLTVKVVNSRCHSSKRTCDRQQLRRVVKLAGRQHAKKKHSSNAAFNGEGKGHLPNEKMEQHRHLGQTKSSLNIILWLAVRCLYKSYGNLLHLCVVHMFWTASGG